MSNITTIVLNDGTANQNFIPVYRKGLLAKWQGDTGVIVSLRPQMTLSMREGSSGSKRRVIEKILVPYQPDAIDGVTQNIETVEIILTANIPENAPQGVLDSGAHFLRNSTLGAAAAFADAYNSGRFVV